MALGYVVALVLEAAGLVALLVGLVRLRAESRVRAAELRGLLLTGNANAAGGVRQAAGPIPRRVVVEATPLAPAPDVSTARAALHRALDSLRQVEREAA
ncbi:hypothetical protein [Methylobacterium sp. J-076]|uniref:hypothetical protein n=1 Tax=Methylobacterium sp. J-076 TaxID=2836655 RepID=UPI001FB92DD3|nr:hypothetical protein [Methylobacterium sp. J-076]MCJ2011097.1 hypothetical protein [Methylobacterium sp. J-076]